MAVIQPPRLLPVLAATVGLFRHRRTGLNDPAALPRIERSLAGVTLDADWLAAYRASVGLPVEPALPPLALPSRRSRPRYKAVKPPSPPACLQRALHFLAAVAIPPMDVGRLR